MKWFERTTERNLAMHPGASKLFRSATAALAVIALAGMPVDFAQAAVADQPVGPASGKLTISGAGWGHGRGMSQYGARGAAQAHLTYDQILAFYYADTKLDALPKSQSVRVWISADNDASLHVRPASGLRVLDSSGKQVTLPRATKYTKWRIKIQSSKSVLHYRDKSGTYRKYVPQGLNPSGQWFFDNANTGTVKLDMPGTLADRTYRGKLSLADTKDGPRTVNTLPLESYLRSVVPSEMPAYWELEALKAQAVAARTYAARKISTAAAGAAYDLCDTSSCQVYKPATATYSRTDTAISATAGRVITYAGKPVLAEYSASNGGWSAPGGLAYQQARKDPYDGATRDQTWQVTLTAKAIEAAYPSLGTLKSVQVLARDGQGSFGGRVEQIRITGSKGKVDLTGGAFKKAFGLKERLFKVTGAPVADPNNS